MTRRVLVVAVVAAMAVPVAQVPAGAQALPGTIVFIRGDQIWATDGAQERQVTSAGEWRSPSMADDGTIVGVRDEVEIVRLTVDGDELSAFVPSDQLAAGVSDAVVSPDGAHVAYSSIAACGTAICKIGGIVRADGSNPSRVAETGNFEYPAWLSNERVAGSFDPEIHTVAIGESGSAEWFDPGYSVRAMSLSRDGDLLATTGGFDAAVNFFAMNGPPPAPPTPLDCGISPVEDALTRNVSFGPTSDVLVFDETVGDAPPALILITGLDPVACNAEAGVLTADGYDPHWSPAPFGAVPDSGPVDPPPGGGPADPPPGGGIPDGTDRIDGGGRADPIGQAIALSQRLFDDGGASRVVLATADRFPDALAGAALAGVAGPILFTSGQGDLDPRTAAEITRVTGGDAPVLTLGGRAAISDQAAATARAAGGNAPCSAPLPTSCRFAGSGREETAALIATTVAAENPAAAGVAMVARGDDFADAITGGAFAAITGIPILLTPTDLAHPFAVEWLEAQRTELLLVLGGRAAVSDATADGLPATRVVRISGADRTATSAAIATDLWGELDGGGTGGTILVNVRAADGWQAALSGAVASALLNAPQLGVENPPAELSPAVTTYLAGAGVDTPVLALGDPTLVSDAQLAQAAAARG